MIVYCDKLFFRPSRKCILSTHVMMDSLLTLSFADVQVIAEGVSRRGRGRETRRGSGRRAAGRGRPGVAGAGEGRHGGRLPRPLLLRRLRVGGCKGESGLMRLEGCPQRGASGPEMR